MSNGIKVLGIDAGFASIGLALVSSKWTTAVEWATDEPDRLELVHVAVLRTKKSKLARSVTLDDANRMDEISREISSVIRAWEPDVVACEAFAPNMRQGGGGSAAWKTLLSIGIARGIAQERGMPFSLRRSADLAKLLPSRLPKGGDQKAAVEAEVNRRIRRSRKIVEAAVNRGMREHAYDAIGHAILEIDRRSLLFGGER